MLTFLLLAGAGSHVSVDARLGRRVRWLYVLGAPDARQLTIYVFGLFAGYGLISFAALLNHMTDGYWQGGDTVAVLLTSSYLSRLFEPTRAAGVLAVGRAGVLARRGDRADGVPARDARADQVALGPVLRDRGLGGCSS